LSKNKKSESHREVMVHQHLHGERTTMTMRILPEVKRAFTKRTRELGLSTCHVAEGLFTGWVYGVGDQIDLVHQSPTINMTLVRDVKRVRRYFSEVIEEKVTQTCTIKNCKESAVAKAFYKPKNQEHLICSKHLEILVKPNPKSWQLMKEPLELG
jgi:hypothetical protein